jgi:nucleoside-diphosphate-sugar epimerase
VAVTALDLAAPAAWLGHLEETRPEAVICAVGLLGAPSQRDPDGARRLNSDLPATLARQARAVGVARFVHMSSFGVYGHLQGDLLREDMACAPTTVYGHTKAVGEARVAALAAPGFEVAVLRIAGGYGPCPGPPVSLSSRYLHHVMGCAEAGAPVDLDVPDRDIDEVSHADDVASAAARAAIAALPQAAWIANVGPGRRTRAADLADALRAVWPSVTFRPGLLWPDFTTMPPLACDRLRQVLGDWSPQSLACGLAAWRTFQHLPEFALDV